MANFTAKKYQVADKIVKIVQDMFPGSIGIPYTDPTPSADVEHVVGLTGQKLRELTAAGLEIDGPIYGDYYGGHSFNVVRVGEADN